MGLWVEVLTATDLKNKVCQIIDDFFISCKSVKEIAQ